jgi:hypothetical protein
MIIGYDKKGYKMRKDIDLETNSKVVKGLLVRKVRIMKPG